MDGVWWSRGVGLGGGWVGGRGGGDHLPLRAVHLPIGAHPEARHDVDL